MNFTSMRFKDYTWPHNPESFQVSYQRKAVVRKVPFGRYCTQDLGLMYRVMQGEGDFTGSGAYDEFCRLAAVFCQDGPGMLTHPVLGAVSACFITLQLTEKPLPNYVRYAFTFWENETGDTGLTVTSATKTSAASGRAGVYCTVKKGDTLWGIASAYGVTLAALIAANPQIKNPNLIYPGDRVRIK